MEPGHPEGGLTRANKDCQPSRTALEEEGREGGKTRAREYARTEGGRKKEGMKEERRGTAVDEIKEREVFPNLNGAIRMSDIFIHLLMNL